MRLVNLLFCILIHLHLELLNSLFDFPVQTLVLSFVKVEIPAIVLHSQLFNEY